MSVKLPIPLATNMAAALLDQEQFAFLEINFEKMNQPLYTKTCFKIQPEWPKFWFMYIWPKSCNPTSLPPLLKDYTSEEGTSSEKNLCALAVFPLRLLPGGKNNLRSRLASSKSNKWGMRGHLLWRKLSSSLFSLTLILPEPWALGYTYRSWHVQGWDQYQNKLDGPNFTLHHYWFIEILQDSKFLNHCVKNIKKKSPTLLCT